MSISMTLLALPSLAQDAQYSQFYAAPLYLNPAFAGNQGPQMATVGGNFRTQWPGAEATFTTYSAFFDYFYEDWRSGFGAIITRDVEGFRGLSNIQAGLQYAYELPLTKTLTARAGMHVGAIYKTADFSGLIFGDQLDQDGNITGVGTAEPLPGGAQVWLLDLATGVLFYSPRFWLGGAVWHLNRPNQSVAGGESLLRMKTTIHAGYKIPLRVGQFLVGENEVGQERSLSITAQYKLQGAFQQLESGLYATLEPLVVGLWYRGIPIPNAEGNFNNDGLVALVGMTYNGFNLGYSFDYTLSNVGIRSGGAHEVSVTYDFFLGNPRKPPLNVRRIPCPRF
ncbi:MAG: PorP/SprF family type IX secretion system membrane protein [Bacteroidota bacterium]